MKKYKVKLLSRPKKYLKVIAHIKYFLDIRLIDAKMLVDKAPTTIAEFYDKKDAVKLEALLKDYDAEVKIVESL